MIHSAAFPIMEGGEGQRENNGTYDGEVEALDCPTGELNILLDGVRHAPRKSCARKYLSENVVLVGV